jgi:hypothetical protein
MATVGNPIPVTPFTAPAAKNVARIRTRESKEISFIAHLLGSHKDQTPAKRREGGS